MEKVTNMMDCVMAESIDDDEYDGCDGKNKKSIELKNNVESKTECNTVNKDCLEKKEESDEFLQMPSRISSKEAKSHVGQSVMDNRDAITVGDKVTIHDCPGYWNWGSPFKVEAIQGEMAKLEMVGELVEIQRLCKCKNTK